jgi:hypothetical protein
MQIFYLSIPATVTIQSYFDYQRGLGFTQQQGLPLIARPFGSH